MGADSMNRRFIPADASEWPWAAPDGHLIRRIDWSPPLSVDGLGQGARGSLMFMGGLGEAYEKYLETFEYWRQQGWQVSSADWRGQAGSGRLGHDGPVVHAVSFETWLDDFSALWRDWAARASGPRVLVGHSMGGHLSLRAVAERRLDPMPDAVVLSAPMLGIGPSFVPLAQLRLVAALMNAAGDSRRAAWRWDIDRPAALAARQHLLTHDDARYQDELWWRRERPEISMGPASWGWVRAALASITVLQRPGLLETVDRPMLIFGTSADRLVRWQAIRRAALRLPQSELLGFGAEARHEILRESDAVRGRALDAIDRFLDRICA